MKQNQQSHVELLFTVCIFTGIYIKEKEKITIQSAEGEREKRRRVCDTKRKGSTATEKTGEERRHRGCGTWRGGQRVVQRERENERTKIVFTRVMESAVVNTILFYIQPSGKQSKTKYQRNVRHTGREDVTSQSMIGVCSLRGVRVMTRAAYEQLLRQRQQQQVSQPLSSLVTHPVTRPR